MTDREHVTDRAHGIDVSHYQTEFIYAKTWGQMDFAIAKIGEGYNVPYSHNVSGKFDEFNKLWVGGVDQVPIRGLYHYQRGGSYGWERQATAVLEAANKLSPAPHILALDLEHTNNVVNETMIADFRRIAEYWQKNSRYMVMGYWNVDIFQNYLYPLGLKYYGQAYINWLMSLPMWLGQYWYLWSPNKQPGTPRQRQNWDIWQYTQSGDSYGMVNGERWRHYGSPDLNVYNGSVAEMRAWLKIGAE